MQLQIQSIPCTLFVHINNRSTLFPDSLAYYVPAWVLHVYVFRMLNVTSFCITGRKAHIEALQGV